jgi:hypothetical protein
MSLAHKRVAMKVVQAKYLIVPLAAFLFLAPFPAQASAEVRSTYLYSLANFFANSIQRCQGPRGSGPG